MHIKLFLVILFAITVVYASAQKNLLVYHVTGNVNIIKAGKPVAAKRGDILSKNISLQLIQGADCMLIEEKGKSLQVNAAGTFTYEALQKMMLAGGKAGVTQKFFSYVYENMFSGHQGDKLSVTPVVFRGYELMKTPSDKAVIISDALTLEWDKPSAKMWVHLTIKNNADETIVDTVLRKSASLEIDQIKNNFVPGSFYKWKAEESGTPKPTEKYFYFLIAKKNDRRQILNDLKILQDTGISKKLRIQLQEDIFQKWKQYYSRD